MPGVIAEAHWDTGRNFVALVNGTRRYILAPPTQCEHLFIMPTGPSARHSSADWSSRDVIPTLRPAKALEVVMRAGDVLYLPAFWFHYIINLSTNVQCNTRSGTPDADAAPINACAGSNIQASEQGTETRVKALRAALPTVPSRAQDTRSQSGGEPEPDYPKMFPLQDILRYWNPDNVTIPSTYGQYSSLRHFDFMVRGVL